MMQCQVVNKTIVHILMYKMKLMEHLEALKNYALMYAGDTMDEFIELVYVGARLNEYYVGNITAAFDGAVKSSSRHMDTYADNFKFVRTYIEENKELIQILYKVEWPLNIVLNEDTMMKYSRVFTSLLKLRRICKILNSIKVFFHNKVLR